MRIQNNIMALNAHRQLGNNNNAVSKSLEKLSSGFKINRAGDDAAGLAISEKMRAQIKGLEAASTNSQDGISLVQTAEGALTEVHSMLNRMVELATKASNGTYQNADREKMQAEVESLNAEIDRISKSVNFNKQNLLDGSLGMGSTGAKGQVTGADGVPNFTATLSGVDEGFEVEFATGAKGAAGVTAAFTNGKLTLTMSANAAADKITQSMIDDAIRVAAGKPDAAKNIKVTIEGGEITTTGATGGAGALTGTLEAKAAKQATVTNTTTGVKVTANKAGADPRTLTFGTGTGTKGVTVDTSNGNVTVNLDAGKEYSASDINAILRDAGVDMTVEFEGTRKPGAQAADTLGTAYALAGGEGLAAGGGLKLQIGDTSDSFNKLEVEVGDMSATALGVASIDVSTADNADAAIDVINNAINTVSKTRSDLGAVQNRLEHTINNLGVTTENLTTAESRIRDADMAKEMMTFTKDNVLSQAAQAMLAQANQQPQSVLQLLQ